MYIVHCKKIIYVYSALCFHVSPNTPSNKGLRFKECNRCYLWFKIKSERYIYNPGENELLSILLLSISICYLDSPGDNELLSIIICYLDSPGDNELLSIRLLSLSSVI